MQPLWPKKNTVKFGLCTTFRYAEKDQWIQVALPGHLLSANRLPFLPETNTERSERRATELPIFQFYESYSCHQLARSSGLCFAQICVYSMTCDSHQIHRIKTWQVAMLRIPWKHQCVRIEYDALPLALLLSHILHTGYHCQRFSNILKSLCLREPERMGGSPSKQLQHSTSQSQMQEVYTNWKSLKVTAARSWMSVQLGCTCATWIPPPAGHYGIWARLNAIAAKLVMKIYEDLWRFMKCSFLFISHCWLLSVVTISGASLVASWVNTLETKGTCSKHCHDCHAVI